LYLSEKKNQFSKVYGFELLGNAQKLSMVEFTLWVEVITFFSCKAQIRKCSISPKIVKKSRDI
jgi:hypothetical protein